MKFFSCIKRVVAFGLLTAAIVGLSGCGGKSSGSGGTGASRVAKIAKSGNFAGTVDAPTRGTSTACTIQFSNGAGVASFVAGTPGQTSFLTYSADIDNIVFNSTDDAGLSGTLSFDMVNFTAGAPYQGTLHYTGTYTWNGVSSGNLILSASGTLTGKDLHGADVSIGFGINYQPLLDKIDLSGTYAGTIDVGTSLAWTGTFAKVDDLHLLATIPYGPSGALGTITFTGQNARASFAGSFDGAQVGFPGTTGLWYVETHDNGATLVGAYVVLDGTGAPQLAGSIAAHKTTGGTTGGTTNLSTAYYDGGMITDGTHNLRIFKLDVTKNSATVGNNGAAVIVTGTSAENIGGRVASITGNGNNIVITIDQVTNTYTQIVLTGTISGSTLNVTYSATLVGGGTETGTFDALGRVTNTSTFKFAGTWTGTITGQSANGKPFSGTFAQVGDALTITPTTTVEGYTIPTITGFVAGNSFVGHFSGHVDAAGTFPAGNLTIDFDGDVANNKTSFSGSFASTATPTSGSPLSDSGTFVASKS